MSEVPDGRRVAIEVLTTLTHLKSELVAQILRPVGIPDPLSTRVYQQTNAITGKRLSKREAAPVLLDAIEPDRRAAIIGKLVQLGATWHRFDLAYDEYVARATVQKAREVAGLLSALDEAERRDAEAQALDGKIREQESASREEERIRLEMEAQSRLLLSMFDELHGLSDHQKRGYLLQDLLQRTFDLHGVTMGRPFQRNAGAEQIDGAFTLGSWRILLECRWRTKLADIRELDGLVGQVGRSGKAALGLFVSIEGWSENVPNLLVQNSEKSVLLMDGYDVRLVLRDQISLRALLDQKLDALCFKALPFLSVRDFVMIPPL